MSFEYNGVVYRDLEPQVRYDAEQVQLLKQADVTINENLQTMNTEIDGKLTKPTNPSAESAVTMLADGTVGTKLLSEIGGGGKLYQHEISIVMRQPDVQGPPLFSGSMTIITNTIDQITTVTNLWKWCGSSFTLMYVDSTYSTQITGFPIVAFSLNNQNANFVVYYLENNVMVTKTVSATDSVILDNVLEI